MIAHDFDSAIVQLFSSESILVHSMLFCCKQVISMSLLPFQGNLLTPYIMSPKKSRRALVGRSSPEYLGTLLRDATSLIVTNSTFLQSRYLLELRAHSSSVFADDVWRCDLPRQRQPLTYRGFWCSGLLEIVAESRRSPRRIGCDHEERPLSIHR